MKRFFLFQIFLLLTGVCFAENPSVEKLRKERFTGFTEETRVFCPEWRIEVVDRWPDGSCREVLFVEPERNWPMKRFSYYEGGELAQESELEPPSDDEEGRGRLHGASVCFYETGVVKEEHLFRQGKKEGREREYSPEGVLIYEASLSDGVLQGVERQFSPAGTLLSEEMFEKGVRHGSSRQFYEDGAKKEEASFQHGLLEGKRYCWWENGTVQEVSTWRKGFLHNYSDKQPALLRYDQDGKLIEQKLFLCGMPQQKSATPSEKIEGVYEERYPNGSLFRSFNFNLYVQRG